MMEIDQLLKSVTKYLKLTPTYSGFEAYLNDEADVWDTADILVMTLPSPRLSYYQSSDYDTIQKNVIGYSTMVVNKLGFYPINF